MEGSTGKGIVEEGEEKGREEALEGERRERGEKGRDGKERRE